MLKLALCEVNGCPKHANLKAQGMSKLLFHLACATEANLMCLWRLEDGFLYMWCVLWDAQQALHQQLSFFFKILEKEIVQDVARDCLQKLLYTQSLD